MIDAARSTVNSDDRTLLGYTAPRRSLKSSLTKELAEWIRSFEEHPFAESFPTEDATQMAVASASTTLASNSDQAERFLRAVPADNTTQEAVMLRARLELNSGDAAGAAQLLASLASADSNQSQAKYWLAIAQQRQSLLSAADATLSEYLRENPDSEPGLRAKADTASGG